ncbi:MAG TPA: DUF1214 domain-containing protein [Acidimicrobiales bacterium]|nr:DUF1214 domain-containing protein [Acidimicrobiales bacterium]
MNEHASSAAPSWLPAAVASAYRHGSANDEDLVSGRAWTDMLDALGRAAAILRSERAPTTPVDQAAGYRHLLVLLALAIDEALRPSDPYDPFFAPANVDNVLKWGMDCPDAAYSGAAIRPDATYRIRGRRGSVRYLGFQVMSGIANSGNVVADDLEMADDGSFEIILSAEPRSGNWMALPAGTSSVVVRQFFYDWDSEEPSRLTIECLDAGPGGTAPAPVPADDRVLSAAGIARQLAALGQFVEASVEFWLDIEEGGRAQGLNLFRPPAALLEMGAAAENVSVWGSWELEPDEALVIEVATPEALYWSVSLGNFWWETIDYANHQSSLNGHQAVVDPDGIFRAVVAGRDPGVVNWLDTAGHRQGAMIFRWLRATDAPVPATRVVKFAELAAALPADTSRVDPEDRAATIARRRSAVRRRFPR